MSPAPAPRHTRAADLTEASRFPNRAGFDSTCWLGGGQQGWPKPYSQDLRDRVIDAVRNGGMSRRAAARRLGVSDSVAVKWLERVERQGLRTCRTNGRLQRQKLSPIESSSKPETPSPCRGSTAKDARNADRLVGSRLRSRLRARRSSGAASTFRILKGPRKR